MKYIITLLLLLFITVFIGYMISMDFTTSIIPGWHTTIYPPYFTASFIVLFMLCMDGLLYWSAYSVKSARTKGIVLFHFIVSCVFAFLIGYPHLVFTTDMENDSLLFLDKIMLTVACFVVFQLIYLGYMILFLFRKRHRYSSLKQ